MVSLPPFDHPDVIAGQGTLGLEMLEELPEAETLVVPLSGGGLIAGIAMAAKTLKPTVMIIGVTMQRGAARSEEHTSELQSLMRISYAVFCSTKKKIALNTYKHHTT